MVLHKLPAGSFRMGSENGNFDEKPVRTVKINSFFIATTETTYAQWIKVHDWARGKGYVFDGFEGIDTRAAYRSSLQCPMNKVSWFDCIKWCNAASEMDRRTPCYAIGTTVLKQGNPTNIICTWTVNGYRLPTGAEWEYAARAGAATRFPWGSSFDDDYCWYYNNSGGTTHPVGEKRTNAWGIHDMSGNVFEWCWDAYQENYRGLDTDNPKGPQGIPEYRVFRGGAFNYLIFNARPAHRSGLMPNYRLEYIGFRIASSL
ncbi:MAG: SUMF1/EgtB/PvdO family nonheme iron enzyme [Spirochaetota bacterium]